MRRFLIWSALAVVIGAALAVGGYWAYWHFYGRFQPVVISRNQAEIQRLLDESSWISSGGGGQIVYMVGYRDCANCQRYERQEFPKLRAAGVETRVIVFARPDREGLARSTPAERATVAELWLNRDWDLYERWNATPSRNWTAAGIPAADGNLARTAVVDASRDFVARLEALLRGAGVGSGYPLVLWRDQEGYLKACACSDARSYAFIRDDLQAPEAVAAPTLPEDAFAPAPIGPGPAEIDPPVPVSPLDPAPGAAPAQPEFLPDRRPPTAPPPSQEAARPAPPAQPRAAPAPAPARPAQPQAKRPATPPPEPQPRRREDSVFF